MRTNRNRWRLLIAASIGFAGQAFAQADVLNHNGGPGFFLGWNAGANQVLEVKNEANQPINWFTDAIQRLMLYPTNNATLNSFTVPRHGFVAISPQPLFYSSPGPFSRLHLVDSVNNDISTYAQEPGYRPWMRNGVTMTGNSDQMYIGHKYAYVDSMDYTSGEIDDRSDAVIEWSDNPDDSPWGTDRLRFMFTNAYSVATPKPYGARSLEGMEAMRVYIPTDTTANVGIGDFFRAGVINGQNEDPTERLHVKDGRVRIQQLPDDAPADSDYVVMVVDTTASPSGERGVVKWVPIGAIASAADCEWNMTPGTGAGVNDVWTAVGGVVDECPDETEGVGIGTNNPGAKLDVETANFGDGLQVANTSAMANVVGIRSEVSAATGTGVGLVTQVSSPGTQNIGAVAISGGASNQNVGVQAWANGGVTSTGVGIVASGGSAGNTALQATVNSAGNANTGFNARVSDGTASNRGVVADVSGPSSAINIGGLATVSGSGTLNMGDSITVSGTSTANTGAGISTYDGRVNRGVNIRARTTASGARNYGVDIWGTTTNETSENHGVRIYLDGAANRVRGVLVENHCTNAGAGTNYGGYFRNYGTDFLYSYGLWADSHGASTGGVSRGVTGTALGAAAWNTGVSGTFGTGQPLDAKGGFGVFGQSRVTTVPVNIGTAGYVEATGGMFFPNIGTGSRNGVAGVCRPSESGFSAGTMGYVGSGNPASWLNVKAGVFGRAQDTIMWAGYYEGNVNINGSLYLNEAYVMSDESVKENIGVLEAVGEDEQPVVGALEPILYNFTSEAVEQMGAPVGMQAGLSAQQVQQVLPHLVKTRIQPALLDTLGNVVHEERTVLTVNYVGLIPYLIADNQRLQGRLEQLEQQQADLAGLQEQLEQLQEQVAACCAAGGDGRALTPAHGTSGTSTTLETDLRIIPNPVADRTELRYTVGTEGTVRLTITGHDGRTIRTQDEGLRATGTYSYGWDTTALAPGTYHCTLFVNDELVVRKAVKVAGR